jgi:hypothetical protein
MSGNKRARSRPSSGRRREVGRGRGEQRTNGFAPFHELANVWIHDGHDWMYVVDYTDGGAPIGAYVDGFYRDFGEPALAEDDFANAEAYGRYRAELAMLQQRLHEARRRAETVESVFG